MSKKFYPIEPLDDGCVLGKKATGKNAYWYVRMYWKDKGESEYRSTKILYEDSRASRLKAKRKANAIWQEFLAAVSVGDNPREAKSIKSVADDYQKQYRWWAEENERLGRDVYIVKGTRVVKGHSPYWTTAKADKADNILRHLEDFWKTLPTRDFRKITQRDLSRFSEWAAINRDWSPSWTHQNITQIRMIWRYAFDEGLTDFIPSPFRPPAQTAERAGRSLQADEWLKMVYYAKEKYESIEPTNKSAQYNKDAALQFWVWLNFVSWTGFRPPSGKVIKNLPQWNDLKETKSGDLILVRRDKTQYEAPVFKEAHEYLDFLRNFQRQREIDSPYIFAHSRDKAGVHRKGDPIKSFRKQWETMLKETALWDGEWGLERSEKLVPYSLRGFFITMSLNRGVDVRKLAKSLGTSVRVIDQTYDDFQTERELDELLKGSGVADLKKVSYDEIGYPILS